MRELPKELFHLVVFLIFIMKSLDVAVAIHPPLHTGMDQSALMCPVSQWSSKVGFFSAFRPSILSLHVSLPFSLCFTSCGQEAGAATLHHCTMAWLSLNPIPCLHQTVPFTGNQSQADSQASPRTHHWLWPCLGLEDPPQRGPGAAACMDSLALVTLHHHTAGWLWHSVFRWGPQCALRFWGGEISL